jgi:hypothetical protein
MVYAETSIRHYVLVMQEAHAGEAELPRICRRETLEKLFELEEQIGINSMNFIDEFHRISMALQKAVMALYGKKPKCKRITLFLKTLSAARNCQDLLAVTNDIFACYLEDSCCETESI